MWEYRYLLNDVQIPEYPSKDLCENPTADCEKSNAANGRVRNRLIPDLGKLPAITDRCRYQMESAGIYQAPNLDGGSVLATFGTSHLTDSGNRWELGSLPELLFLRIAAG